MSEWTFEPLIEDDGDLTLEWYQDKHNVVTVSLGKDGLTWAAMLGGRIHSGALTPLKASVTVQSEGVKPT